MKGAYGFVLCPIAFGELTPFPIANIKHKHYNYQFVWHLRLKVIVLCSGNR